ncbi:MAG: hypothetical protein ABI778_02995 [Ignavibacteriota bacterium]
MKRHCYFLVLILLPLLASTVFGQKEYVVMGSMQHSDIEGGCWFLQAKDQRYQLTGTAGILQSIQIEGRNLVLNVRDAQVRQSICMMGKIVEVVSILDSVFHPHNPPVYDKFISGKIHKTNNGCWYVLTAGRHKFELQAPIPKQFMHIGARYKRLSKVIPGPEGNCNMEGVITISMLEPDMKAKTVREKKYNSR